MFLTKKINNDVVAVVDTYPVSIRLRKSGKKYYETEEYVCKISEGKLVVNKEIAAKYGLDVVFE